MKRAASILLLGTMVLSLVACGKTSGPAAPDATAPAETTAAVEETAPADTAAPVDETAAPSDTEEHVVSGIVNRLGDHLVLLVDEDYLVFELGKDLNTGGVNEGDEVTLVYTGTLGDEKNPPVVTEITKD